jgi:hypothetical protein
MRKDAEAIITVIEITTLEYLVSEEINEGLRCSAEWTRHCPLRGCYCHSG